MALCSQVWQRVHALCPRIPPRIICALMTLAVWGHAAVVLAQRSKKAPEAPTGGKSYVLSYALVVLCVALGLLVVCRSGGRANEPKQELPQ